VRTSAIKNFIMVDLPKDILKTYISSCVIVSESKCDKNFTMVDLPKDILKT